MAMQAQASATLNGNGTAEVDRLLIELGRNLESARASLQEQETLLARVKVYGRDTKTAGPIFSKKGIETLSKYALDAGSSDTSREALRCLANAFLLNEPCRQTFVDLGFASKAAERLKLDNRDDEFLISRMLFLLTYNTRVDFTELIEQNGLADSINQHIATHAKAYSTSVRENSQVSPMESVAMTETLKLLFNITYYDVTLVSKFTPAVEPLINLLLQYPLPSPPLQPPLTSVLNALLNLNLSNAAVPTSVGQASPSSLLFPRENPEVVMERLVLVFDASVQQHPERDLDLAAAPLCTLLRRAHELADPRMKNWMCRKLLPQEEDRDKPLGQGESLPSRLLRMSTSASLPTLRENISGLLFELSDKDASKFVQNIGYGFASGFLMSHGIAIPASATEGSNAASGGVSDGVVDVNPVTGQWLSAEEHGRSDGPEMTEEEKEREAERLFVLFERLRATGVVDVQNPVQRAVDEGRFEELPD